MNEPKEERKYVEMVDKSLIKLGGIAERPAALQEIGQNLVRQAVENAVAERLGEKLATPMVVQKLARGDVVPLDLLDQPDLVVDLEGKAASGWEKSWLNLIVWQRGWNEKTDRVIRPSRGLDDPNVRFRLETILTAEELAVVNKLKIVE